MLVLTGAGRGFCAGQDLGDRAVAPGSQGVDLGESIENHYNPLVLALRNLPMPVIAAVNGVAAGAGANIALACDIVIAARSANFVQAFSKLGLIPDSGGTWFLPRLVGDARALGLTLLGNKLPAEQAAAWGLIWQCVEDAELAATVDAMARQFAVAPTRGLAATKECSAAQLAKHVRRAARRRARCAARAGPLERLCGGRRGVHREALAALHRPLACHVPQRVAGAGLGRRAPAARAPRFKPCIAPIAPRRI